MYNNDQLPKINILDKRKHQSAINSFMFVPNIIHQFSFELIKNSIRAIIENTNNNVENGEINIIIVNSKNGEELKDKGKTINDQRIVFPQSSGLCVGV